VIVSDVINLA